MNDLKLTEEHDLDFSDGNLSLLDEEAKVAKQTLKMNLLFYEGEWFLDNEYGVPYFQEILTKGATKGLVDSIVRDAARKSYNIQDVLEVSSTLTPDRKYSLDRLLCTTTEGEIVSVTSTTL